MSAFAAHAVDIRAYRCPMTWVRVKLALERLAVGEVLEVLLQGEEPERNIPRSAVDEGHQLVGAELTDEGVRIWLRKGC
ncbi:MAG TPA: sulfurtransferase TusA family protein [Fredinandcohnia sp.]|nr:sulfurtransferase TusA family protein [Fredinandcohnia sp.]